MNTSLIFTLLTWLLLGVYILRKNMHAARLSRACGLASNYRKEWAPFLRVDQRELPGDIVLLIRSFLVGPPFFALCIVSIAFCGLSTFVVSKKVLHTIANRVSCIILFACGIKVKELGVPAKLREAPCIVANHNSAFDIIILLRSNYAFVAMEAVRSFPVVGTVAIALGSIFVARDSKDSRSATKTAISDRLTAQWKGFPCEVQYPLVVFPEGSTTNGNYLLQFRRGAFDAQVPVQPLWIEFQDHILNYTVASIGEIACLACSLPAREVTLHWLPVVEPNPEVEKMAETARDAIANCDSAYGRIKLIKENSVSHRDAIACSGFFRQTRKKSDEKNA